MVSISSALLESTLRFTVNTKTLERSKSVKTPEFQFSNSKWKVRFSRKRNDRGDECLAIHLECVSLKKTSIFSKYGMRQEWSREAQATFKLLQTHGHSDKSVVRYLSIKTFQNTKLSHGIDDFIEWAAFFKDHAHDNLATFEINISASPLKPKRNTVQKIIPISTKMLVVIKGAKDLITMSSSEAIIQGIRWRVCVKKLYEHLGVFFVANENDMDANWFYKVDARVTLISSNLDLENYSLNFVHKFQKGLNNVGYPKFIKWSDFVDITKGLKAEFNIEIKVEDPEPTWQLQRPTLLKTSPSFECIATPS